MPTGVQHTHAKRTDLLKYSTEFDLECSPHLGKQPHVFAMAHDMAHSTSQGPPLLPQILASLGKSPIDDPNLEMFPQTILFSISTVDTRYKSWRIKKAGEKKKGRMSQFDVWLSLSLPPQTSELELILSQAKTQ